MKCSCEITLANKTYKTYAWFLVLNFCASTFRLQRLEKMCVFKRIRFIAKRYTQI